jgi:dihydrofolate synthase / folylpolyglutamate synthase
MNTYSQTTHNLFDLQKYAIKLGLDNITTLSSYFNNPHLKYPTIHIAGTNGKGSTAFYIANILQTCGLKVGLYTSPHLADFRERIRINDELINKEYIIEFWNEIKNKVLELKATFFDATTLLAFKYFADMNVDVGVFETGLGGRLDSTNILKSEYVVLTPISFDHQKQLGNNLRSIATEKAGIIKNGSKVYSAKQSPNVKNVFTTKADGNTFHYLPECLSIKIKKITLNGLNFCIKNNSNGEKYHINLPTMAAYQADNFSMAYFVANEYCQNNNYELSLEKIIKVVEKSSWPGRLQLVHQNPHIIFDVSHNLSGIKKTIHTLFKLVKSSKTHLLIGIVNDKDAKGITEFLAGKFKNIIITEPQTSRKQDGKYLQKMFKSQMQNAKFIKDLQTAFEVSKNNLYKDETLIALGSHYLIGALMGIG